MKIVKLLILIVVVVGVVFGITLIPSIKEHKVDFANDPIYQEIVVKINDTWGNDGSSWNRDTYDYLTAYINTNRKEVPSGGFEGLRQTNALQAVNALHKSMMEEFAKSDCQKASVSSFNDDLMAIIVDEDNQISVDNNAKAAECKETYQHYLSVLDFGKRSHDLKPGFNKANGTFNSFDAHKAAVTKNRDNLKNHSRHARIQNITEVKNALDIDGKLEKVKKAYPQKVASAITYAFRDDERNQDNLNLLRMAFNNYSDKYSNSDLSRFYRDFNDEVKRREADN